MNQKCLYVACQKCLNHSHKIQYKCIFSKETYFFVRLQRFSAVDFDNGLFLIVILPNIILKYNY